MTDAMKRVMSTPLAVDVRGRSVRVVVAADKYTVTQISEGMNDREDYARLFSTAPDLLVALEWLIEERRSRKSTAAATLFADAVVAKARGNVG